METKYLTIKTPVLRDHLLKYFDKDGDGQLTADDVRSLTRLRIDPPARGISSTNSLKPCEYIHTEGVLLDFDDVEQLPELRELHIFFQQCETVELRHPKLQTLIIYRSNVLSVKIGAEMTALKLLMLPTNCLERLEVACLPNLERINVRYNNLLRIRCGELAGLKSLDCSGNYMCELDLCRFPKLTFLNCALNSSLKQLDTAACPDLACLACTKCKFRALHLAQNKNLKVLQCCGVPLRKLDVSRAKKLQYLDCTATDIDSLDISECKDLLVLKAIDLKELFVASEFVQNKTLYHSVILGERKASERGRTDRTELYIDGKLMAQVFLSTCENLFDADFWNYKYNIDEEDW